MVVVAVGLVAFVAGVVVGTVVRTPRAAPSSALITTEGAGSLYADVVGEIVPTGEVLHDGYRVLRQHRRRSGEAVGPEELLFHGPDGRLAKQELEHAITEGVRGTVRFLQGDIVRSVVEIG